MSRHRGRAENTELVVDLWRAGANARCTASKLQLSRSYVYRLLRETKAQRAAIDLSGPSWEAQLHDDLWASIPAEAKRAEQLRSVHRCMEQTGLSFKEASALYMSSDPD